MEDCDMPSEDSSSNLDYSDSEPCDEEMDDSGCEDEENHHQAVFQLGCNEEVDVEIDEEDEWRESAGMDVASTSTEHVQPALPPVHEDNNSRDSAISVDDAMSCTDIQSDDTIGIQASVRSPKRRPSSHNFAPPQSRPPKSARKGSMMLMNGADSTMEDAFFEESMSKLQAEEARQIARAEAVARSLHGGHTKSFDDVPLRSPLRDLTNRVNRLHSYDGDSPRSRPLTMQTRCYSARLARRNIVRGLLQDENGTIGLGKRGSKIPSPTFDAEPKKQKHRNRTHSSPPGAFDTEEQTACIEDMVATVCDSSTKIIHLQHRTQSCSGIERHSTPPPDEVHVEYQLPCVSRPQVDSTAYGCINGEVLAQLLTDKAAFFEKYLLIDCRYPYEYHGGHIEGSKNFHSASDDDVAKFFFPNNSHLAKIPIFYCEFSQKRGPTMANILRKVDRKRNNYPAMDYKEMYLLDYGYKRFFETVENRIHCAPQSYTPMDDPSFRHELRRYKDHLKFSKSCNNLPCLNQQQPIRGIRPSKPSSLIRQLSMFPAIQQSPSARSETDENQPPPSLSFSPSPPKAMETISGIAG